MGVHISRHKIVLLVAFVLLVCVCFTSCNGPFSDPKSLMTPPKASGDLAGIEAALSDAISGTYTFVYPSSGDYRSAFISEDINADGENEAIVFYQLSDSNDIHANYFLKKEGNWKSAYDIKINGTGVDCVDFADLCGDNKLELLIGCNLYNNNEKELYVYSVSKDLLVSLCEEKYTNFSVCSLYDSVKPQIVIFSIGSDTSQAADDSNQISIKKYASASLISLSKNRDGTPYTMSSVFLDNSITSVSSIVQSKINDDLQGLYVDAYKGSSIMVTELLYFDKAKNQLVDAFYNNGDNTATRRQALINSRDIDSDGKIEIPLSEVVPGYENANFDERLYYTLWRQYDGMNFKTVAKGYFNSSERYFIRLPEKWFTNMTVIINSKNSSESFNIYNATKQENNKSILEIKIFVKTEFAKSSDRYTEIIEKNDRVYAAKINTNINSNEYTIDLNYVKQNLIVF